MTEPEVQETRSRFPRPPDRDIAVGRAILDRRIAHIHDIRRDLEYQVRAGQMTFRTGPWRCHSCGRVHLWA